MTSSDRIGSCRPNLRSWLHVNFFPPTDVTVTNSSFTGWDNGMRPEGAGASSILRFTATGNAFTNNDSGVFLLDAVDAELTGNGFFNQTTHHIWIRLANGLSADLTGNEFSGTGDIQVINANGVGNATVDASGSWWGQDTGPAGAQLNPDAFSTIVTAPLRHCQISVPYPAPRPRCLLF